jgi:hypothetical protein
MTRFRVQAVKRAIDNRINNDSQDAGSHSTASVAMLCVAAVL